MSAYPYVKGAATATAIRSTRRTLGSTGIEVQPLSPGVPGAGSVASLEDGLMAPRREAGSREPGKAPCDRGVSYRAGCSSVSVSTTSHTMTAEPVQRMAATARLAVASPAAPTIVDKATCVAGSEVSAPNVSA